MRTMLKSKIYGATVTEASLDSEGSVTIDADLMEAASVLPFEQIHLINITNGARLQTYASEGMRGSGAVGMNGDAAKLVSVGDLVIILAYDQVAEPEARGWRPTLVYVNENNEISRVAHDLPREAQPSS